MIRSVIIVILFFSFASCATIFTKKSYELELNSYSNTKVQVYDSIYKLPTKLNVIRSKNNLPIILISDSLNKEFILKPSISPKFLYGNLSFVHFAPIGYLIDLTTVKRFY
jgi:hypothetical protein